MSDINGIFRCKFDYLATIVEIYLLYFIMHRVKMYNIYINYTFPYILSI